MMMRNYIIAIIMFNGLCGCINKTQEEPNSSAETIRAIDRIKLTDLNGQAINVEEHQGKTIFINFWATWCKPCIQEMPFIEEAQRTFQNENILFLLASSESAEEIEEFISNHNYSFKYVRIENSEEMNVQALPTTFIFNRQGDLVFSETGFREWSEKQNIDLIKKIVKQND